MSISLRALHGCRRTHPSRSRRAAGCSRRAPSCPPWPPPGCSRRASSGLHGHLDCSLAAAPRALPGRRRFLWSPVRRLEFLLQTRHRRACSGEKEERWERDRSSFFLFFRERNNANQKWLASSAVFHGMSSTSVLEVYS
jgi:hypothetical protein